MNTPPNEHIRATNFRSRRCEKCRRPKLWRFTGGNNRKWFWMRVAMAVSGGHRNDLTFNVVPRLVLHFVGNRVADKPHAG